MSNFFNSPILTLLQSGPKTPEQQVQYATSSLQQYLNGGQRVSLPDFTQQPIQIKPIIPARDATGTAQSVRYNTHTDQVPTNVDERLKQNRQILGDIVETVIDFTPVIGDIKGLTWDPIKAGIEGGFGAGLSMAGLGLVGLVPGVGDAIKKSGKIAIKNLDNIKNTVNQLSKKDIDKKLERYWPKPIEPERRYKSFSIKRELQRAEDEDLVKEGIPYISENNDIETVLSPKRIFADEIGDSKFNLETILNNIFINAYKKAGYLTEEDALKLINDLKIFKGDFSKLSTPPSGLFNGENTIVFNNKLNRLLGVSMHETGHYLDKLGYWNKGENPSRKFRLLNDAYQVIPDNQDLTNIMARDIAEKYATNVKLRYPFAWDFYKQYKEVPQTDQISQFISDKNNEDILQNIRRTQYADGYIPHYLDFLIKNKDTVPILKSALTEIFKQGGKINESN